MVAGADLAICHLETPLAPAGGPFTGYPSFSVPPQIASAIAATGYDTCSTASNHTIDKGEAGVARTLAALDAARVKQDIVMKDAGRYVVNDSLYREWMARRTL